MSDVYFGYPPATASFITDTFSGDGTVGPFSLTAAPGSASAIAVFIDGVYQFPGAAYSVSGLSLTFTGITPVGTNNIEVLHLGVRVEVPQPAAGTVGPTELDVSQHGGEYVKLTDTKATTTDGGTATSGSWQTRALNTEDSDTGSVCTLSSNQFTLPAGTYRVQASAPAYSVDTHQLRIRNITDSTTDLVGLNAHSYSTGNSSCAAHVSGEITIASAKTFELQHRFQTTHATNGLGTANSFGENEVYAVVEIWKVK